MADAITSKRKKKTVKRSLVPIEGGLFVPVTFEELDSEAYMSLSGNAAKVYGYLKRTARTAACKGGTREREVVFDFTYSEAKSKGFSESTFIRAIKELWAKGFIDVVERGGLRGTGRTNSRYKLSPYWKTWGAGPGKWVDRSKVEEDPFASTTEPRRAGAVKW